MSFPKNRLASWLAAALVALASPTMAGIVPQLESNPGATHTLFLDFDGHSQEGGLVTCGVMNGIPYGYNLVAQTVTSVSDGMRQVQVDRSVNAIWETVADDFASFDVNVTTVEPPSLAEDGNPTGNAVRVAIGVLSASDALGHATPSCSSPSYEDPNTDNTAYVAWDAYSNVPPHIMGRRVSHEAGHVYGLRHHENISLPGGRAAIMGYTEEYIHTWHAANNRDDGQWQDDLAQLRALLGVRADDHSDSPASATTLEPVPNLASYLPRRVFADGVIEDEADEDMFTFRVTQEGNVDVRAYLGVVEDLEQRSIYSGTEGDLVPVVELWNQDGSKLIAAGSAIRLVANAPGTLQMLLLPGQPKPPPTLATGATYRAVVRSQGGYGEFGLYTLVVEGPVADLSGPRVVSMSMVCPESATTERAKIVFDQPITYGVVTSYFGQRPFVHITDPRNHTVPVLSLVRVDPSDPTPSEYYVSFPNMTIPGSYRFEIGPQGVEGFGLNPNGNPYDMDQDSDGIGGETPDDVYSWSRYISQYRLNEPWYLCGFNSQPIHANSVRSLDGFNLRGF